MLIGLFMAVYIVWYARRRRLETTRRFSPAAFARSSINAIWALGVPIVILGGIYSGIFTPTEAAGIAGIYGILVSAFVYRDIGWTYIWEIAVNSAVVTAQLLIIVAGEWQEVIGKETSPIRVLEQGTGKVISEMVL